MNLIQILMTPSEVVNNVLTSFFVVVEIFLYEKLFTNLLHITVSKKQALSYVVCASALAIVANLCLKDPLLYLFNLISFFLFVKFLFKQTVKNSFLAILVSYISIFISAYISQIIMIKYFGLSSEDILTIPLYHLITSTLIYLLFGLIYLLLKNRHIIIRTLKPSLKSTIIINLALGTITIFILAYIFSIYRDAFPIEIKLITLICLLIYFFISMYSLIRTNKLEQTSKDLESEKIYNQTLTLLHDNIRCFKHDFDNIIQILGGYIDLNDMNGLRKYYKSLLAECKLTNNLNILNPQTINNPSIYSLLNNKYYKASEYNVTINFEIFSDLSKINSDIYELSRILGILLDNAIEAARETDEKIINIILKSDKRKQIFIIENSCVDNNISTTKIFEKGYSTKENNSGIGLWKVHKILAKNTDIDLFTTVKNNMFKQELSVYY